MTHEELQAHFIYFLKSNTLKRRISELDYQFSDLDLLLIAYKYAPTWYEMMGGFRLIAEYAKPEIAAFAIRCIEWQEQTFATFMKIEDNTVLNYVSKIRLMRGKKSIFAARMKQHFR